MFRWLPARLKLSNPTISIVESRSSRPVARLLPAKPQMPETRIFISKNPRPTMPLLSGHLSGSIADCFAAPRVAFVRDRNRFDLDARVFRQRRDPDGGSRRRLAREVGRVNLIHFRKISEVGQEDGRL